MGDSYLLIQVPRTSVTGGTVRAEVSTANGPQKITSRAPFYNLIVANTINSTNANAKISVQGGTSGDNGTGKFRTLPAQDLVVLNDLTVENSQYGMMVRYDRRLPRLMF